MQNICGACERIFLSEEAYNTHLCEKTGFTPQDPQHLGPEFTEIQRGALERGLERLADPVDQSAQQEAINSLEGGGNPMPATPEGSQSNDAQDLPVS